jgi:hypothetical protein
MRAAENLPDLSGKRPETSPVCIEKGVVRGSNASLSSLSAPFTNQTRSSNLLVFVSQSPLLRRNRLSNAPNNWRLCAGQDNTQFQSIFPLASGHFIMAIVAIKSIKAIKVAITQASKAIIHFIAGNMGNYSQIQAY